MLSFMKEKKPLCKTITATCKKNYTWKNLLFSQNSDFALPHSRDKTKTNFNILKKKKQNLSEFSDYLEF